MTSYSGSVLFTLLMIALLLWAQTAGAVPLPNPHSTIAYRLARSPWPCYTANGPKSIEWAC